MSMVESIEVRIKEYETAIANSIANHNGLLGGLNELKSMLEMAGKVTEVADDSVAVVANSLEEIIEVA